MPLVSHVPLPTFDRLRGLGEEVLTLDQARHQDIRELHIGLLNMMPDAALRVTERQFLALIGACNQIAQLFVHVFSVDGLSRGAETQQYIDQYYTTFEQLQEDGLDALVITGANVANPLLQQEPFWESLEAVIGWAAENVTSVLCSCLATHALVKQLYGIERQPLPRKLWGVYGHRAARAGHPLLRDVNTRFDVPHSRHNAVTREQLEAAGLTILVESDEAGVHMAVSPDQLRVVYFQGHPEYSINSLLKEYKREASRYCAGERQDYPLPPANYFPFEALEIAVRHQQAIETSLKRGAPAPPFPEAELVPHLDNTWGDSAKAVFNNWLGLVYKLTDYDRRRPLMPGIDPNDPLGLRRPHDPR